MIHGVTLSPLPQFTNELGTVSRMLRATDPVFQKFGEVYFSSVPVGVRKDWRLHRSMTMHLAVPVGTVRFVLFDSREHSPTKGTLVDYELGASNYQLLTVPNGIWMTFGNRHSEPALVANCATEPHNPDEVERRATDDPPVAFTWE